MKKIILLVAVLFLAGSTSIFAQNGRPAKVGDAPVITPRNSLDKDVTVLGERLTAMEKRLAALEADNAALKTDNAALKNENAAQQKQLGDLEATQKTNYKILENYTSTLKTRFDTQVGDFKINGFISNKSLATSGSVNLLMGTHQ